MDHGVVERVVVVRDHLDGVLPRTVRGRALHIPHLAEGRGLPELLLHDRDVFLPVSAPYHVPGGRRHLRPVARADRLGLLHFLPFRLVEVCLVRIRNPQKRKRVAEEQPFLPIGVTVPTYRAVGYARGLGLLLRARPDGLDDFEALVCIVPFAESVLLGRAELLDLTPRAAQMRAPLRIRERHETEYPDRSVALSLDHAAQPPLFIGEASVLRIDGRHRTRERRRGRGGGGDVEDAERVVLHVRVAPQPEHAPAVERCLHAVASELAALAGVQVQAALLAFGEESRAAHAADAFRDLPARHLHLVLAAGTRHEAESGVAEAVLLPSALYREPRLAPHELGRVDRRHAGVVRDVHLPMGSSEEHERHGPAVLFIHHLDPARFNGRGSRHARDENAVEYGPCLFHGA